MTSKMQDECEQAAQAFAAGNAAKQAGDQLGALAQYSASLDSARSVELRSALLANRSLTLATLGRYEEALADGLACAEIRPSWSRTFECQASALHGLGHTQEADASARLAAALAVLKKDPKNAESKQRVKEIRRETRELREQRLDREAASHTLAPPPTSPGSAPQSSGAPADAAPGSPAEPATASDAAAPAPQPATNASAADPAPTADPAPAVDPAPATERDAAPSAPSHAHPAAPGGGAPRSLDRFRAPPPPPELPSLSAQDSKEQATNLIVEGNSRQQEQDYEGALACYCAALRLHAEPDMTAAIYFNCSIANSYMQRFEDALKDAEECIRINPMWARGFECKGTALEGIGRLNEAKEAFEQALIYEPDNQPLRNTIQDLRDKIDDEEGRSIAPTPAEFDGILDDVPTVAPTPVPLHQSAPTPHDYPPASQAEQSAPNGVETTSPSHVPGHAVIEHYPPAPPDTDSPPAPSLGEGLSEEERHRVREMVKSRRRRSGSVNQTLEQSPNHHSSAHPLAQSTTATVDLGHPNPDVTTWASDSARLNEQFASIRAREEALLQRKPSSSEGAVSARAVAHEPPAVAHVADPLMEKLQKQQDTIREQGDRIQELDQIVRASAHKTGRQLEDQVAETKDQIVALEQLSAAQANEHRKLFTKLIDTLNKLEGHAEVLNGGSAELAEEEEQQVKLQQRERENAEAWLLREREKLLQEQEVEAWKIVTMGKEISKLENHAMELRTQYLDKERSGRAKLETLHSAIRAKDAEIDMLDAEMRKARSNLTFARKMVSKTSEASLRSESEFKINELHAHIQYMEAIKSIENLKRQVAQEEHGLEVLNDKIAVMHRAMEQATENSQLMAHRLVPVPPSSSTALPDSSTSRNSRKWVLNETPAVAAWTPPPAWGVNPVKVPTMPPVAGTSAYEKPKLSGHAHSDNQSWPTLLATEKGQAPGTRGPSGELATSDYPPSPLQHLSVPAAHLQGSTLQQPRDQVFDVWF